MNWWLDLGKVYCYELNNSGDLSDPAIPSLLFEAASNIGERKNPYLSIINKTLLNNYIANPKNKPKEQSEEDIKNLFAAKSESKDVNCSFCDQMTTADKDSIAGRKWIVSGGWEESPLYAGGGYIPPRICLDCRRLSILAAFKAYELFVENKLPFIIYNPDIQLYKKLLDNLLLRKDLNLNFEKASSVFLSLGSMLIYPEIDKQGNIESFDLRPLLPDESVFLMNLTGIIREKKKEKYLLETLIRFKNRTFVKIFSDYLKFFRKKGEQKPTTYPNFDLSDICTILKAYLKTFKGGIAMSEAIKYFNFGKELGEKLDDKAYSAALGLYKSTRDIVQFQKQLIGVYLKVRNQERIPDEMAKITEIDEKVFAFIMGIMNTIKK